LRGEGGFSEKVEESGNPTTFSLKSQKKVDILLLTN
jgi:hypothetical protein